MFFAKFAVILTCYNIVSGFHFRSQGNLDYLLNGDELVLYTSDGTMPETEEYWIDQPVDHFNESDIRTWKMRYFQNLQFWEPNGPIYIFINGEAPANPFFTHVGFMCELAKETKGAIFLTEHRYYGKSQPFEEHTTDNLKFLKSTQVLADNKKIIENIKNSSSLYKSSKVVVVGASYAGNLAAWMRLVYPSTVDAAIASSAPVLAKADFSEYIDTLSMDYRRHGTPGCFDKVAEMFKHYEDLLQTDDGIKILIQEENICPTIDMHKFDNQQTFLLAKVYSFIETVQYGNVDTIQERCRQIDLNVKQFETYLISFWNAAQQCYNYEYDDLIQWAKSYPWIYQSCTEFGYFLTSNSNNNYYMGHIPVDSYYKMCTATFGPDFNKDRVEAEVAKTNAYYEGLKPNVTNVVFVNGELDPWHRLGVIEDLSETAPAKLIPLSSHCNDLGPSRPGDSKELKEARIFIKNKIKKFIGIEI